MAQLKYLPNGEVQIVDDGWKTELGEDVRVLVDGEPVPTRAEEVRQKNASPNCGRDATCEECQRTRKQAIEHTESFKRKYTKKYFKGLYEHGGDLMEKDLDGHIDNLEEEILDMWAYMTAIKTALKRERNENHGDADNFWKREFEHMRKRYEFMERKCKESDQTIQDMKKTSYQTAMDTGAHLPFPIPMKYEGWVTLRVEGSEYSTVWKSAGMPTPQVKP